MVPLIDALSMAKLLKLKHVQAGHHYSVTKMIGRCKTLLTKDPLDRTTLLQLKMNLQEKLDILKRLDEEILGAVEEDRVAEEIELADDFCEGIFSITVQMDSKLTPLAPPTPASHVASVTPRREPSPKSKVRLPKISLQPFDGELTSWTPFWDAFKAAIHDNDSLTDIDKFNYLRGLLQRTALKAISGIPLTSANHRQAVVILEKRFGNRPLIVAKHMDTLIHVDPVTTANNVKGLCRLYDLVESNVRSLASLGVEANSYGGLLASVLILRSRKSSN